MKRLFIALPIAKNDSKLLKPELDHLSKFSDVLKIISPDNYHVTLKFIGEIKKDDAVKLIDEFSRIHFTEPPIQFKLKGLGYFKGKEGPRVIWAGLKTDLDSINHLINDVNRMSPLAEFADDKSILKPHLTLARIKKNTMCPAELISYIDKNKNIEYFKSQFNRIVLYNSELKRNGPVYTEIKSVNLKVNTGII